MRTTTVVILSLAALTTGCATQSGIIDVFAPPQAQTTAQAQPLICDPARVAPEGTATAADALPCVVEVATAAVGAVRPRPFDQRGAKRPIPPRRLR
jgi:hypothetical protein